jgi:hypothetical protein
MTPALRQHVAIRAPALKLVPETTIKIILSSRTAPEWKSAHREQIVHQLCNRPMKLAHHRHLNADTGRGIAT